jgi:hypothetical protein
MTAFGKGWKDSLGNMDGAEDIDRFRSIKNFGTISRAILVG